MAAPVRALSGLRAARWALALSIFGCCTAVASAVEPAAEESARIAQERAAIRAERERLEQQFAAEHAACDARFAVTACRDAVRDRRRAALQGPRSRELALDDAERKARAAARREAVLHRQRAAAMPPPAVSAPAAPAAAPPRQQSGRGRQAEAAASHQPAVRDAEAVAARRAAAARARQAAARDEQARIAARQAERARQGKAAAALPVPASRARPPAAPGSAAP